MREFQRAHSHARGHWVRYDMRIREYIRQRVDASVREQIQQWEGDIVEDNVENVQQDDSSNNPFNSVMEDDEAWAVPGISQPPTAAIQAPAVHPLVLTFQEEKNKLRMNSTLRAMRGSYILTNRKVKS